MDWKSTGPRGPAPGIPVASATCMDVAPAIAYIVIVRLLLLLSALLSALSGVVGARAQGQPAVAAAAVASSAAVLFTAARPAVRPFAPAPAARTSPAALPAPAAPALLLPARRLFAERRRE